LLLLSFGSSFLFSTIFTTNLLYQATVVALKPLQLVLVGTILETSVFLFEIPTGVLADLKSRRLSIIIGYALMGLGFILEGAIPRFWAVAGAQVLWGVGYTFTSGATEAWAADEIGESRVGEAFMRGSQAGRVGSLLGIPLSVWLGSVALNLPILSGGALMLLLAGLLALLMTERGFTPIPAGERTTWASMLGTVRDARRLVARQPMLLSLLGIGLFYGLYSEGLDRLWTVHLLSFSAPFADRLQPVVWFGAIRAVAHLLSLGATEIARRRVNLQHIRPIARVLMVNAALLTLALAGFALAPTFGLALALYWLVGASRSLIGPLQDTWLNLCIDDPQVRATMFSVGGQVDSIGQIAGGPLVGAIGNASVRAALVASAGLLAPVMPLYAWALKRKD
jgi:DHA3 family tetracycline resistance protein-like MFS transporter